MKKISLTLLPATLALPLVSVISCGSNSSDNLIHSYKHMYLTDKSTQDSITRKHINFGTLTRKDIDKVPPSLNGLYDSKILAGGWAEKRQFYFEGKTLLHTGVDVFLPQGTNVYAPADAEVLASYWIKNGEHEFGQGIGGTLIMKVKIANLDIDDELKEFIYVNKYRKIYKLPKVVFAKNNKYIEPSNVATKADYDLYISKQTESKRAMILGQEPYIMIGIIHLSQNLPFAGQQKTITYTSGTRQYTVKINTSIDNNHPLVVKKGDLIGHVGTMADNGGWVPHMHVNAYSNMISLFNRAEKYVFNNDISEDHIKSLWRTFKPSGVYLTSHNTEQFLWDRGYFNPNNLFNFYNPTDKIIDFKF